MILDVRVVDGGLVGHLDIGPAGVEGDTPSTSDMAAAYMARVEEYDPDGARDHWLGWSNGYLVVTES